MTFALNFLVTLMNLKNNWSKGIGKIRTFEETHNFHLWLHQSSSLWIEKPTFKNKTSFSLLDVLCNVDKKKFKKLTSIGGLISP